MATSWCGEVTGMRMSSFVCMLKVVLLLMSLIYVYLTLNYSRETVHMSNQDFISTRLVHWWIDALNKVSYISQVLLVQQGFENSRNVMSILSLIGG